MEKMYNIKEVAKLLNVSRNTVYKYIEKGLLKKWHPYGFNPKISQTNLDNFLKHNKG